ncbi:MAG: hypothetical protein LUC91_04785 [Prevotella sp.]|nr:hypothetical protein [Prevotella sp.]
MVSFAEVSFAEGCTVAGTRESVQAPSPLAWEQGSAIRAVCGTFNDKVEFYPLFLLLGNNIVNFATDIRVAYGEKGRGDACR